VSSVLAAGHEPYMSRTVSWLASGGSLRVEMKKGSVAHLDVHLRDRAPAATLRWLMTPKLARRLVKGRE
jgi:phosphohistidine phosphatase SixA